MMFNFYPRSPCGERLWLVDTIAPDQNFYPRSPCGERPVLPLPLPGGPGISIHALLAESDFGEGE